jgi:hypothetical protein
VKQQTDRYSVSRSQLTIEEGTTPLPRLSRLSRFISRRLSGVGEPTPSKHWFDTTTLLA